MTIPDFLDSEIVQQIERLPREVIDELPYGVIQLDADGNVTHFSKREAAQSGFDARRAAGKHFFTEIAPCLNHARLQEQLRSAAARGTLDITFESIGDFRDADRELRVRVKAGAAGCVWVFIERFG